jgi:L-amino acid N-acyltransferase YncA
MEYSILPMLPEHWTSVREIYAEGIASGNATFETEFLTGRNGMKAIARIAAWLPSTIRYSAGPR